MSAVLADGWTRKTGLHDPAEAVFPRVFARISMTLTSTYFRSSHGVLPLLRDGTDPLFGGLKAAPGGSHTVVCSARGAS